MLGVAVFLPLASHAQKDTKDTAVMELVSSARKLYEELEYDRALEVLSRARQLKHGQDADVALWLYQGIVLFDSGKHEESAKAFREALDQRPQVKLPLPMVSPKMGQFFESLRQERNRQKVEPAPNAPRTGELARPTPPPAAPQADPALGLEAKSGSGHRPFTPPVLISAAAGGSLLATGGIFFGLSKGEKARIRADDPRLVTREDLSRSASRGATYQALGLGLMGAGLVGMGVATGLHLLRAPQTSLALTVSTDGTSAFVQGRLP